MATTFVHIGDFHAAAGPRNADRYRALEQIQEAGEALAARGALGAWLWPGDLNHARMTIDDRNRLAAFLIDMARVAPVVICDGNHDLPGDLDIFEHLGGRYPIYVIHVPHCLRIELATGEDATIFVLPYPQKAGLVSAGVATGDVVSTAADLMEPIFMQAAAELEAAREAGDFTLMIGHVNIAGSIPSASGQPNIGHEIELNPKHLERLGDIPKLLNHIHKPQEIAGAHYAGSVCRLDYGEIEEKRFLLVTFYDEDTRIESVPLDVAPMFHVDGVLSREGFQPDHDEWMCPACHGSGDGEPDETVDCLPCVKCAGTGRRSWAGCDVRVRYRYNASERSVISEATVRELFAGALRLKIEGVAIADRELRAPEVAAAKTLPEKLAAYRKVPQLEPSVASKIALLQDQEHAGVLAAVADALAAIEQPEKARLAA